MFAFVPATKRNLRTNVVSEGTTSLHKWYKFSCLDMLRELILGRELDKAMRVLSIIFVDFVPLSDQATQMSLTLLRTVQEDSSFDRQLDRFYQTLLRMDKGFPAIILPTLIEYSRYLWKRGKIAAVYDIWIYHTTHTFFALSIIEVATFLGLISFQRWMNDEDQEGEEEEEEGGEKEEEEMESSGSDSFEDEEMKDPVNQDSDEYEKIEIFKEEKETKKMDTGEVAHKIDKLPTKSFFPPSNLPPREIEIVFQLRTPKYYFYDISKRIITTEEKLRRRYQKRILTTHEKTANDDFTHFYRAKDYLALALQLNPSCETCLAHYLYILEAEEKFAELKDLALSFCQENPLNPFGFKVLAQVVEDHFPTEVAYRVQVYAKILDIDPVCAYAIEKLLLIAKNNSNDIHLDVIQLCLSNTFSYWHLKDSIHIGIQEMKEFIQLYNDK